MDGDHNIEKTAAVQEKVLATVYKALSDNGVFLEGSLLKPSMTVPGAECTEPVSIVCSPSLYILNSSVSIDDPFLCCSHVIKRILNTSGTIVYFFSG